MSDDLKRALELFDCEAEFARRESEMVLKTHGASEEEMEQWRQTDLLTLNQQIALNRDALIRCFIADAENDILH